MNAKDRARINRMIVQVDYLMNGKGNGITNADVVEAVIGDLRRLLGDRSPEDLATLVAHDDLMNRTGLGV